VDRVTDRLIGAMKKAGCARILFGIESGSQKSLDSMGKNLKVDATRKALELCRRHGVQTTGFLMLGAPNEKEEDMEATVQLSLSLPLDIAKFNVVIPYPGTAIYDEADRQGALRHKNWEDYSCYVDSPERLPLVLCDVEPGRLLEIQEKAIRRFFLRPGMIFRHLFKIRTVPLKYLLIAGYNLIKQSLEIKGKRTSAAEVDS